VRRSRKFEEELAVRKRPSAPVDDAVEEHGLADEALRLQELVGNTNTTAAIARSPLQRDSATAEAEPMKGGEEEKASGYTMTMSDIGSFDLLSFSWGQSKPIGGGGESGEGKQHYSDLVASKRQDELSPKLMEYAAKGRKIDTVEVVIKTSKGAMTATMKGVYISGYQTGGGGEGSDLPTETFTLTFDSMEWKLPEGSK
jgi:type VI protein secretion system component Hcp